MLQVIEERAALATAKQAAEGLEVQVADLQARLTITQQASVRKLHATANHMRGDWGMNGSMQSVRLLKCASLPHTNGSKCWNRLPRPLGYSTLARYGQQIHEELASAEAAKLFMNLLDTTSKCGGRIRIISLSVWSCSPHQSLTLYCGSRGAVVPKSART